VLLYDNASGDGSVQHIAEWIKRRNDGRFQLHSNPENLGFAGCNPAIATAMKLDADYVFLLNNDAIVRADTLAELVNVAEQEGAAIVGARTVDPVDGRILYTGNRWPGQLFKGGEARLDGPGRSYASSDVSGGSMLLRRDFLAHRMRVSGHYFDPQFFMYFEDTDLCRFASAQGYRCLIARDATVSHGFAGSSGGVDHPRIWYYIARNRIYVANRWLNGPWKLLFHLYYLPSRLILQALRPRTWGSGTARSVLSGILDGYSGVTGQWHKH
jgi:GT2 family glycosyltransferase